MNSVPEIGNVRFIIMFLLKQIIFTAVNIINTHTIYTDALNVGSEKHSPAAIKQIIMSIA